MNETQWIAETNVRKLTKFLPQPLANRKCVLAVCGYCRRIEEHIPLPGVIEYFMRSEKDAMDGCVAHLSFGAFQDQTNSIPQHFAMNSPSRGISYFVYWCIYTASEKKPYLGDAGWTGLRRGVTNLVRPDGGGYSHDPRDHSAPWREYDEQEALVQGEIVRDIFGNPFRPVTVDPAWLTSTVVALARGIYDERAFDRMPILADALQDAGCDNDDMLNHCRDEQQVHVRGCWVVDMVLGKV